jgi:hypothetical protein
MKWLGADAGSRFQSINEFTGRKAKLEQAANVFAKPAFGFRAENGIRTSTMQVKASLLVLFQNDLIGHPSARDLPNHAATGRGWIRVSIGQSIGIGSFCPFAIRAWKQFEQLWLGVPSLGRVRSH